MTGANLRPFRVAFWALLAALGLSVVVTLSDPRSVRLAILAKTEPPVSVHRDASAVARAVSEIPHSAAVPSTPASIANNGRAGDSQPQFVVKPEEPPGGEQSWVTAVITRGRDNAGISPPDAAGHSPESEDGLGSPSARQVSSPLLRFPDEVGVVPSEREGSMPVLSPTRLQHNSANGEYFELPPPPEWDQAPVPRPPDVAFGPSLPETESFLFSRHAISPESNGEGDPHQILQRQLEAEIAGLKRELDHLAKSQHIGHQLDQLHRQQQQILSLHRQLPIDRLSQLLDSLLVQLQSVRDTIPPAHGPRATMRDESSLLVGEGSNAQPGRVSIRITEARLDEILRMLSTLSGTSIVTAPEADMGTAPDGLQSESATPRAVGRLEQSDVRSRAFKDLLTSSGDPLDPDTNSAHSVDASDRWLASQNSQSGDCDAYQCPPDPQAAASATLEVESQSVSVQQELKRTASASSCVACHRAKGIR